LNIHRNLLAMWKESYGSEYGCQEWFESMSHLHNNNSQLTRRLQEKIEVDRAARENFRFNDTIESLILSSAERILNGMISYVDAYYSTGNTDYLLEDIKNNLREEFISSGLFPMQ
jgi:hypothetical protein